MRVVAFSYLLLCFAPLSLAQQQSPATKDNQASDSSTEPFVIRHLSTKVVFENDGTSSLESTASILIQSQAGLHDFGVLNFPYASGTSTFQVIYVRVLKPDGRTVQTPAENVLDMPTEITRQAPFYSDLKDEQIAVKGLEIGDTLEYQCRTQVTKPIDPGQFWFSYDFFEAGVILDEELQLSVPRNREVILKSPKVQPTATDQGAHRVYSWKTAQLQRKSDEKTTDTPDPEEKRSSVRITTFRSWDEVGQWFRSLAAPRAAVTPEIQAKADELSRGAKTDSDKIQAIYNFVSTKFRYIGVSLGIGRYQPHAAADVLTNDYGDCKDKHTLFAALLAAENIKAYPALINSAKKVDPDFPSPEQFNHVITALPQEKGFLFLDTTPEVAPLSFLLAGLRDKKALVIPDTGLVQLIQTPADPPFKSFFTFQTDGTLDDAGTFDGKMQMSLRGDQEILYRLAFRQAGQPQWKDVMQNIVATLGYGGKVQDVMVASPDKTDEPFQLSYTYERKEYGDWAHRQIISPLPFLFLPAVSADADKNSKPIKLGSPKDFSLKGSIKLPPKSDPRVPSAVSLHEAFGEYQSTYSASDGVLHFERHLTTLAREISPAQIEAYRKFQKAIADDEGTYIPLSAEPSASNAFSTDPEAVALYEEGRKALQAGKVSAARDFLQRAVDKDPKFSRAWSGLAVADMESGDADKGKEDMKNAVASDPTHLLAHKMVAFSLMAKHQDQEALEVWRQLEKSHPEDMDAPRNAASILLRQKRYSEAVPELESFLKNNPTDGQALVDLGEAYLRSGNLDKGAAVFNKALSENRDATTLNNVAFQLADNNIRLTDALHYAEEAVGKLEDQTSDIDLDNLLQEDLRTPLDLAADWDTLGWVHFRLGHLNLAEGYLKSAWNITQDPVIADHLGQVYEKEGKTHDAVVAYSRASVMGQAAPENTRARLNALRPNGKYQPGERTDLVAMQELRSAQIRKVTDERVSAEFFLLFHGDSKAVDVELVSGSDDLRPAGKILETTKLNVTFPQESSARILRRGILDCQSGAPFCMFVLVPPDSVKSLH